METELLKEAELLRAEGLTDEELKRAKAKVIGQKKIARQDLGISPPPTALDELYGLGYAHDEPKTPATKPSPSTKSKPSPRNISSPKRGHRRGAAGGLRPAARPRGRKYGPPLVAEVCAQLWFTSTAITTQSLQV